MIKDALRDAEMRMRGAIGALEEDFAAIRTGRASPTLVERLMVEYYGTPTPLKQLATCAAPEPQLITIRPFDPTSIGTIEKAIRTSDLGLTPSNDGKLIRLSVPPLTEERRQDLVKLVSKRVEEAKVAVRNIRRDILDDLREFEKEKLISEDDFFRAKEELQKVTDRYSEEIDKVGTRKEQEIMEV
jgi:ribosome recycling factor